MKQNEAVYKIRTFVCVYLIFLILLWYNNKYRKLGRYRSLASVSIGREDFARMFVPFAEGTNADRRFAIACPREELPSFAIGLLKI